FLSVLEIVSGYSKELNILDGVSLIVKEGQMVSIIGPNGAGKSTVLKTIFGILQAKNGQVIFKDEDLTNRPSIELLKKGFCFVPQGRNLFPLMTVGENLELGAYIKTDKKEIKQGVKRIYDMFPILQERKNQKAGTLSGGEMQMLEMGRAMLLDPEIMLIDEPSLGLSPKMAHEVFNKIEEINQRGTSILIVEQNADRSLRMSDYAYVIETGKNKCEGPAEQIRNDDEIKRLYLGAS
ncbi:MAG: ABC transporter ATP-binding protein, partial [Desulfobacteraceae bacterium]